MGNALRFLYQNCCKPTTQEYHGQPAPYGVPYGQGQAAPYGVPYGQAQPAPYGQGPYGVPVGVSGLANDIYQFEITSQVPQGLSPYVVSSQKAQANWYKKLSEAWKEARPPPRTPDEAATLVIKTLKRHQKADVEGLLAFYGLPFPTAVAQASDLLPPSKPQEGLKFELHTLPVDTKSVSDGDTVTVYVDVSDKREAANVPKEVKLAAQQRAKARAARDYVKADALQKTIVDAGYRVISDANNRDILARKYRIRLRGIDAPESSMPFGKEAKAELLRLVEGKCLKVLVYTEDQYGRCVGDIYCNNKFIQESLLKKGFVWHYPAYDKRPELASWEKSARASRVGLWALPNPQEPWEYRKNKRNR